MFYELMGRESTSGEIIAGVCNINFKGFVRSRLGPITNGKSIRKAEMLKCFFFFKLESEPL